MSEKQEQSSEASSLSLVLSAAAQYIQTTAGTLDTCSHYQKVEILTATVRLIELVTEATVGNWELRLRTNDESNYDNGK